MEYFAKRHRQTLKELLGSDFSKSPSDVAFQLLLYQLILSGLEGLLRALTPAQPCVAKQLDTLVSDGKTLRGSIA